MLRSLLLLQMGQRSLLRYSSFHHTGTGNTIEKLQLRRRLSYALRHCSPLLLLTLGKKAIKMRAARSEDVCCTSCFSLMHDMCSGQSCYICVTFLTFSLIDARAQGERVSPLDISVESAL